MMPIRKLLAGLAILALVQTGVLASMVIDRTLLIRNGREIVLPVVPVDPRDIFRGDYVNLAYEISNVPAQLLSGPAPRRNAPFYVTLATNPEGNWTPVRVTSTWPSQIDPGHIVLRARSRTSYPASTWVRYGIESYFVREGEGRRLEDLARSKRVAVRAAVDSSGNAAIKGLIVDGTPQYEEPLF